MYQSTAAFGTLVQQDSRTFKCLLTYGETSITTVRSIKFTGGSEGEDDFSLGSTMSQYIEVTIPGKGLVVEGTEMLLQIGMDVNGKTEYIPMGYFTAGKPQKADDQITFTAYDRMMNTERTFSMDGTTTNTVAVLKQIADITGVPVVTSGLTAISIKVPKGYSCREVLSYVAQLHGAFAVCNRRGQIELHTYVDSDYKVKTSRYWGNFEHNDYAFDVSKFVCFTGQDKNGKSISIFSGSGARSVSFSNPFMTQTVLNNILASFKNFSYMPGTLKMMGDPRLDPWDILTVADLSGNTYKVPIMKLDWEYDGGLTYSVEAVGLSEEETNADYKGPQTKEMERYYAQLVMIDRAMINKLDVETAKITYASIKELDVVKENAEEINAKKANIDLANVNNAWIEKGVLKDGSIGTAAIHEGAITNSRIADATIEAAKIKSLNADAIVAGTIKTERLIITGPDGQDSIVKAINIANGVSEAEVNGQKIQAASIDVVDLSAFQAKIAQFDMSQNAIYSGKLAINDPTSGVYISTTGLGLGDGALTSKKESPIQMYADGVFKLKGKNSSLEFNPVTDMLDINVSNFRIGSKEAATVDNTIKSTLEQFYLSTSPTSLVGGSWSNNQPAWTEGKYIWRRNFVTYGDDRTEFTPSENGVCITGNTGAQGARGPQGATGDKGDTGAQGPKGDKGETGPQGPQGVQGVKGADGKTYYTWVKYADSPTSGMSDNPSGKKYIGFAYNKTTGTESTNYSDYSWSLIKGEKGDKGDKGSTGNTGAQGATGNGIKSITYYYARTTSQTAPSTENITSTTMPALDATNKYLWQKEVITYTNGQSQTTVLLLAVYGNTGATGPKGDKGATGPQGPTGASGKGIKSTAITYQLCASQTTAPTGTWLGSPPAIDIFKPFLWTRTVTTYTDNTTSTAYSVSNTSNNVRIHSVPGNGNTNMYVKFATLTVASQYINTPITFKLVSRGWETSNVQIMFKSINNYDPGLDWFRADGTVPLWIKKSGTGKWELYMQKNEPWGSCNIYNFFELDRHVDILWTTDQVAAIPNGAVKVALLSADANAISRISAAETEISNNKKQIALKASQTEVTNLKGALGDLSVYTNKKTTMVQSVTGWQYTWDTVISTKNAEIASHKDYITFDKGNIILGDSASASKLKLTKDSIQFKGTSDTAITPDSDATAWITGKVFHINSGEIESSLKFGNILMKPTKNGIQIGNKAEFGERVRIGYPLSSSSQYIYSDCPLVVGSNSGVEDDFPWFAVDDGYAFVKNGIATPYDFTIKFGEYALDRPDGGRFSGTFRPYFRADDVINVEFYVIGYVTSGKQEIIFFIPFSRPIMSTPVSISSINGLTIRQNGKYIYNSTASKPIKPASYTAAVIGGRNGLNVRAKMGIDSNGFTDTDIKNIVNNDTCAITASIKITFS